MLMNLYCDFTQINFLNWFTFLCTHGMTQAGKMDFICCYGYRPPVG